MRKPLGSYRVQLSPEFTFQDLSELVPYLSRLGISHVYASPVLRCRQGSAHGYDVVDPKVVNPQLGGETALRELITTLQAHGIGFLLDIVPNHMAASSENPYWMDVLTYGSSSTYSTWFDIDWRTPDPELWGRVVLPVLGVPLDEALNEEQLQVGWKQGRLVISYFEHLFPIDPSSVPLIFDFGWEQFEELLEDRPEAVSDVEAILDELSSLPSVAVRVRRGVKISHDHVQYLLGQIARILESSPKVRDWLEETCGDFSGQAERMKRLLDLQSYQLAYWRHASRFINYRRFFNINDLVAVRQEDPDVFRGTHELLLALTEEGLLDGLRVDHVDGLRDPEDYLKKLREAAGRKAMLYVEKILASDEQVPTTWPVDGTTGYEFLNQVEEIFLSKEGFSEIEREFNHLVGRSDDFEEIVSRSKRRVLREDLIALLNRLVEIAWNLLESHFSSIEFEQTDLRTALVELLVAFPVYRTYLNSEKTRSQDLEILSEVLDGVARRSHVRPEAIAALRNVLLGSELLQNSSEWNNFVSRLQQLSSPVAAKGIEDTALYLYVPLVSLNEVGGEPLLHPHPEDRLHKENEYRQDIFPHAMLATTTHDTKRSADVRARLDVLSEVPDHWLGLVRRWRRKTRPLKKRLGHRWAPDAATEYLFYQSAAGIWPASTSSDAIPTREQLDELNERLQAYMIKAAREGKARTSWISVDKAFENVVTRFVNGLLKPIEGFDWFPQELQRFANRIAPAGYWNSLSRTVIQFGSPGFPDTYQGDELWNFCLVDPDNRRSVDFSRRVRFLDQVVRGAELPRAERNRFFRELLEEVDDGRIKLHLVRTCLLIRRDHPELFIEGSYRALPILGSFSENLFVFLREYKGKSALVVAPRLTTSLVSKPGIPPTAEVWKDTRILLGESAHSTWYSPLVKQKLESHREGGKEFLFVRDLLQELPVGLFISQ